MLPSISRVYKSSPPPVSSGGSSGAPVDSIFVRRAVPMHEGTIGLPGWRIQWENRGLHGGLKSHLRAFLQDLVSQRVVWRPRLLIPIKPSHFFREVSVPRTTVRL